MSTTKKPTRFARLTTTDRILKISWGGYADPKNRRQRWGGLINSWSMEKLDEDVWRIAKSVSLERIDEVLREVLRPSDTALLTYPFGKTARGSAAMRVRMYNGGDTKR